MYHTKVVHVEVDAGGTFTGFVAVPPSRYAGVFFDADGQTNLSVTITHRDQTLATLTGVDDGDFFPLLEDAEILVSGEVNFAVFNASGPADVTISSLYRYH